MPLLIYDGLLDIFGVPWLVGSSPRSLPSSSHDILSVHVCLCVQIPPFYEDTQHIGLEHNLMTSFLLDYFCKDSIFK